MCTPIRGGITSFLIGSTLFSLVLTSPANASALPSNHSADSARSKIDPQLVATIDRDGAARFLVVLREQADLAPASALLAKRDKVQSVYQRLRATADRSQADLRRWLTGRGVQFQPYYILNAVGITAGRDVLTQLANRPEVSQVRLDRRFQALDTLTHSSPARPLTDSVEWNISFIHADQVWSQYGVTGTGAVVGDIDTGLDWEHPALKAAYRGWDGMVADHNFNWWDATTYGARREPYDDNSHGTHTMGTILGYDPAVDLHIGVAYGARSIACKAIDQYGAGQDSWFLTCFQFMLAPWDLNNQSPNPDLAPDVINNSWGYYGGGDATFYSAIQSLRAAGIFVEVSAGNEGPTCRSLRSPGDYDNVFTTGATANRSEILASFSSRGPSSLAAGRIKPDIVAPGEGINSSLPGGGYSGETYSGTSMAGPHVVGVVALIVSARPDWQGQLASIEQLLRTSAYRGTPNPPDPDSCAGGAYSQAPNDIYGWGRLDALAAVGQLIRPGSLQGHVFDQASGNPLAEVTVATDKGQSITTDGDGFYSMTVPAGSYTVTASKYLWVAQSVSDLAIVANQATTQDFHLLAATPYAVGGQVGSALSRRPVTATLAFSGGMPPVTTDSAGRWTATLAAGTYQATATANSPCLAPLTQTVLVPTSRPLNFGLQPWLDAGGYGCDDLQTRSWIEASTAVDLTGDDATIQLALPFPFQFYGSPYTQVNVSTNGNIHFGAANNTFTNSCLPAPTGPGAMIAPFWDDLYVDPSSAVYQATTGAAPNRTWTIEWSNARPTSNDGSRMTFEIQLSETSNDIWVLYQTVSGPVANGQSATAGIQDFAGMTATGYSCNQGLLRSGMAVHYLHR